MLPDTPRVSMITVYYKRAELLDRTVRSMLAQTYPNLEIIVVDDCSPDDTAQRLEAYRQLNDPRLKIIAGTTNRGFTQCMIDAIAGAEGSLIAVQGSGDVSEPERIARQVALLCARPDVGVVGCHYENVVEDAQIVRLRTPNADNASLETLLKGNIFSHGEVMYRKDLYDRVGGYRTTFRFCQDYDLWLRLAEITRFATVPSMLYRRFIQFEGVSYAPDKATIQARYFLLAQRIARLPGQAGRDLFARLVKFGPEALVPQSDRALQKRIFKNCLRQIVWGNAAQAKLLAKKIGNPVLQAGVMSVAIGFFLVQAVIPRQTLLRLFGVRLSH
jgi:glycosyltransferase involved in cell wall biosynthesis